MSDGRLAESFRDSSGFMYRHEGILYREVPEVFADTWDSLIEARIFDALVGSGDLIEHVELDVDEARAAGHPLSGAAHCVIRPQAIPFVSYPYEWSFSQLKDAALLMLSLQRRALDQGFWLKHASAFDVQFVDGRPVFVDTLSFEACPEGRPWVAYEQFCRHFVAPLALMAHVSIDCSKLLRVHIDGIPLDLASRMLPLRTQLSPGLQTHVHLHARTLARHAARAVGSGDGATKKSPQGGLRGLLDDLESQIRRLEWKPRGTEWRSYNDDTDYTGASMSAKEAVLKSFLDRVSPSEVWDLGANTGRFSRLASRKGIFTLAADIDPAAVERNYRWVRESGEGALLPLVLDLTNPSPSLGWDFDECMSLRERGPADLVLALALVHHLVIGNNVPMERVASFLGGVGHKAIVEFVPKSDSQVERLLATRDDIFPNYTQEGFEDAFAGVFNTLETVAIEGSKRTLYLFEAK